MSGNLNYMNPDANTSSLADTDPADPTDILLCAGCAAEAGVDNDAHVSGPISGDITIACQRCGATLVGFAYRAPKDSYTGMAPGAG